MRTRRKGEAQGPAARTAADQPTQRTGGGMNPRRNIARKVASVLMIGVFAAALWHAREFAGLGRWFPELAAGLGLTVAVVHAVLVLMEKDLGQAAFETGTDDVETNDGLARLDVPQHWILAGLAAFPALVVVAGFIPAVIVWMPLFFHFIAGQRWWVSGLETAAAIGVLYLLQAYIGMIFPVSWFVS